MNKSNCNTCRYKEMKQSSQATKDGHCYMFKEEPSTRCMQWKGVNVGTSGHVDHKVTLLSTLLAIAYQHFTLEQWKMIVQSVKANEQLTEQEKYDILVNCPSASQ